MAASVQPPDPKRFKWERHSAVVLATGDWSSRSRPRGCGSGALKTRDGTGREMGVWDDSGALQSFWRAVTNAAADEDMMVPWSPAPPAVSLLQQVRICPRSHCFPLDLSVVCRNAFSAGVTWQAKVVTAVAPLPCSTLRPHASAYSTRRLGYFESRSLTNVNIVYSWL